VNASRTGLIVVPGDLAIDALKIGLRVLQAFLLSPCGLFLFALTAMLLRPPDVPFYEIDRVAFLFLIVGILGRSLLERNRFQVFERPTWPMLALTALAMIGVSSNPFDSQAWSLLAAKFIVPFALFHVALLVFREERERRYFEFFSLAALAYLCFISIAFLVDARALIFPRFILDESLGYHADRARGPFLQAVANGVSLNLLGVLALHSVLRGRIRGLLAGLLLGAVPLAILATMTRAVWLSFLGSMGILIVRSQNRLLRRACIAIACIGAIGLLLALGVDDHRHALRDRLEESGPLDFREAVYSGCWQMFLEHPITGWGVNQMPLELARHVSGYEEKELYPHNTYLELLVEHGVAGLALYFWLMGELLHLARFSLPEGESHLFFNNQFLRLWPVLLGIYWLNACFVVMNYQFVNGLVFTLAGMLAAQRRRSGRISPVASTSGLLSSRAIQP